MGKPIKPSEVGENNVRFVPDVVYDVFNEHIVRNFLHGRAVVKEDAVVNQLMASGVAWSDVYARGYLNVEEAYRAVGWEVNYDRASCPATFTFVRRIGQ